MNMKRKILCVILIATMIISMGISGTRLHTVEPQKPSVGSEQQNLEVLSLGDRAQKEELTEETDESADQGGMSEEQKESDEKEPEKPDNPEEPEKPEDEELTEDEEDEDSTDAEEDTSEEDSDAGETDDSDDEGDNGGDDVIEGDEDDEVIDLTLGSVMTWYKYGKQPKNIVCSPSNTVSGSVNTAQLEDNEFEYAFSLTGEDAANAKINQILVKEGDGTYRKADEKGTLKVHLPNETSSRTYTFQVETLWKTKNAQGKRVEEEVIFTYEIQFYYAMDLELELYWVSKNQQKKKITCIADGQAGETIERSEIENHQWEYTPELTGTLAEDAEFISADYYTESGETGTLNTEGGVLKLKAGGEAQKETYYLTFAVKVKDEDGQTKTVYYRITIVYLERKDIDVSFTWLEKGTTPRVMICQPDETVSTEMKNNQLSAGAVKYEIELIGEESKDARILSITYKSDSGSSGDLAASGALPMLLPAGQSHNEYTISVVALSGGKKLYYTIKLNYVMDVELQMTYSLTENGMSAERTISCENGKTKKAEAVYDDQLHDGNLRYTMSTTGSETLSITSVKCYQSGNGKMVNLSAEDQITLLLNERKTGENTFTVKAVDRMGSEYTFKIMIPYKHRGENRIKINTNMTDGQTVINETKTNLNVSAWSEDEHGEVVSYIPANGEDTKLIVKLDGETLSYVSTSGAASEFILYPKNPKKGDTNKHELYIYAEDPYGNFGELTLTLNGKRKQSGQEKGTATIYIDMSVLGLGIVDSVSYEVLADEPISYSVAKAVLGQDTGEPFGVAKETLGWGGRYSGTLDTGFYLQSLTPGVSADGLEGSSWNKYGRTEAEVLQAIDDRFGEGTGLATLWRCIYRNGLNKSSGSDGSYGEFDFTSGSGWLFSLDGTYYPGLAMSEYSLEDGDVLTLRYTLAHGWDVGGGTSGYGNTVGYCVTALDGRYYIHHQMETIENPDGSKSYVCHCCGLEEGCRHENMRNKNLGDGTHIGYCDDCNKTIGSPELHTWTMDAEHHQCSSCDAKEEHTWKEVEGSNTATCTEEGKRTVCCMVCSMTREETSPAKGHKLNQRWNHNLTEHYQKCSVCSEIIAESQGVHQYEYNQRDDDWYCKICDAGHDWDYCGNGENLTVESATCKHIAYHCEECGLDMEKDGEFPEHHQYEEGICIHCGGDDPEYVPPAPPDPEEPDNP